MFKVPGGLKPFGTVVAAASAAGLPIGDGAYAQGAGFLPPGTTVSVEGGVAFSNYWTTTFPGNPASLIPAVSDPDKIGSLPTSTGSQSKHNPGGYGSFSLGRAINPTLDWRFSVALFDFGTSTSSANASQFFSGPVTSFTNTASVAESSRFAFQIFDFDFGKKWSEGAAQFRAFAGLRGLHTTDRFNLAIATEGTDKVGVLDFLTTTTNQASTGSSHFTGVGPRIGLDVFVGSTWGFVGSVSGALIVGIRDSHFDRTTVILLDGSPFSATPTRVTDHRVNWVGNLSGMVGAAWQFTQGGQLVIGYRLDQWFNIRDSFAFAGFSNKEDVLTQTPFLKVILQY